MNLSETDDFNSSQNSQNRLNTSANNTVSPRKLGRRKFKKKSCGLEAASANIIAQAQFEEDDNIVLMETAEMNEEFLDEGEELLADGAGEQTVDNNAAVVPEDGETISSEDSEGEIEMEIGDHNDEHNRGQYGNTNRGPPSQVTPRWSPGNPPKKHSVHDLEKELQAVNASVAKLQCLMEKNNRPTGILNKDKDKTSRMTSNPLNMGQFAQPITSFQSPSEVTIYRTAVQPEDKFTSSSDKQVDTSDEFEQIYIAGEHSRREARRTIEEDGPSTSGYQPPQQQGRHFDNRDVRDG